MSASSIDLAVRVRSHVLRMVHRARASHVGTCLSMADLLAVLYADILRISPEAPLNPARDRFLLSKGHGAAGVYAVLAERGFFPTAWLDAFYEDGSPLAGHITHQGVPGVEASTGSLGHGLSIGCGLALSAHRRNEPQRVFVILSDGECDEGSNWEAALFAAHHRLDNLIAIVDYNRIQSFGTVEAVLGLEPLAEKWRAFNWTVREIDGHNHPEIGEALQSVPWTPGRPSLLLAHTTKGRGVSFMEDRLEWHYRSPDDSQLAQALDEVRGAS